MKIARQLAWQLMQVAWITVALIYMWDIAADLVTQKEDAANVAGLAIYITVFGACIILGTHYVGNFKKIFTTKTTEAAAPTTKETPNAPKPE